MCFRPHYPARLGLRTLADMMSVRNGPSIQLSIINHRSSVPSFLRTQTIGEENGDLDSEMKSWCDRSWIRDFDSSDKLNGGY